MFIVRVPKLFWLVLVGVLAACASSSPPSKQSLIIGAWQSEFMGQRTTLVYSENDITVQEFGFRMQYEWLDEDRIRLSTMGQEVVTFVEFPTPDEMVQIGAGGTQRLYRVQ